MTKRYQIAAVVEVDESVDGAPDEYGLETAFNAQFDSDEFGVKTISVTATPEESDVRNDQR